MLKDSYLRTITDLRISLTDRCNLKCSYCRSGSSPQAGSSKDSILTFEELRVAARVFIGLGISKIRLTGGEPLLRNDLERLIGMLAAFKLPVRGGASGGLADLAMTTNGVGLKARALSLAAAGLDRVTVSLDALDREVFRRLTGADRLREVLDGISAARDAGLDPVKINAVIIRGQNDSEIVPLARFARQNGISVRFIEFMPIDSGRLWSRRSVVSGSEVLERIRRYSRLKPTNNGRAGETARLFEFSDGLPGSIGLITPVTDSFCGACSRIRLTADGQIRTCLFSEREHDLRGALRSGASEAEIADFIRAATLRKEPRGNAHAAAFAAPSRSMSGIGG